MQQVSQIEHFEIFVFYLIYFPTELNSCAPKFNINIDIDSHRMVGGKSPYKSKVAATQPHSFNTLTFNDFHLYRAEIIKLYNVLLYIFINNHKLYRHNVHLLLQDFNI